MEKLSVFITTYNNARTLGACLEAVKWADEIVVLDSFSSDATLDIAQAYGCVIYQEPFKGYGPQKQSALEKTRNRWVLLLDADEMLSPQLAIEIRNLLKRGPDKDGYELPRCEQMFWRMQSLNSHMNGFLRLFDKDSGHVSDMPVHAAPIVDGRIGRLRHPFYHFGETDIHTKVDKINAYSTGLVADKLAKGRRANPWVMVGYLPLAFLRSYLLKDGWKNGWAGFIDSVIMAFYAFLKYAKLYEHHQLAIVGDSLMPEGTPPRHTLPSAPE